MIFSQLSQKNREEKKNGCLPGGALADRRTGAVNKKFLHYGKRQS